MFSFRPKEQKITTINFLNKDNLFYAFWAAEDKNYFKDNNLILNHKGGFEANIDEVDWYKDNSSYINYLGAEEIDLAIVSFDNLLELDNKYPGRYKAFASLNETVDSYSSNIMVKKGSLVKKSADLSGKTIATSVYNIDQLIISEYAKEIGLKDYKLVKVPYNEIEKYLEEGKVDAAFIKEPKAANLVATGKAEILVKNPSNIIGGDFKNIPLEFFILRADFINNNKEASDKLIKIFSDLSTVSKGDFRESLKNHLDSTWDETIKIRNFPALNMYKEDDLEKINVISDILIDRKYISNKPNLNNIFYKN